MPVSMLRRIVTALLLVSFSLLTVAAQQPQRNPENQPRRVKKELKKAYVEWIRDHEIILTKAERDAWEKLATDDEREKFIEEFWRLRDPDPDRKRV
ncbi:MAG TPA: GWxTD domain-containing protein [Pyrinomonadaceae bacterium]|nr:GWxTD domain-containing protein [Pyrinomonadaceae bacterium]